jgi:DNA-binding FadR family transcriptional regulator
MDAGSAALVAPERIERDLTRQILRGELSPGDRLPAVRALAAQAGVNPNTVQRAIARLEAKGLVEARWGSGVVVLDPERAVDLALVADRLVAFEDDPDRCAAILADLLEVRRALASHLIERHRDAVIDAFAAVQLLEPDESDLGAVRAADMQVAWAVVTATGNSVARVLLATVDRALDTLPLLLQAMYGDPARSRDSIAVVAAAVVEGGPGLGARVEAAMAAVDATTVATYRALLEEAAS